MLTLSGFRDPLFLVAIKLATLKTRSDGADVAGTDKMRFASIHMLGYSP